MKLSEIQTAVYARLDTAIANGEILAVQYSFEKFDRPEGMYIEFHIVPSEPTDNWCGITRSGKLLFNVFGRHPDGIFGVTEECEKILDLFPERLLFDGILIPDEGVIRKEQEDKEKDDGRFYMPLIINYRSK